MKLMTMSINDEQLQEQQQLRNILQNSNEQYMYEFAA